MQEITLISDIQGAADATPLDGQTVTIQAVVTADFQDGLFGSMGDLNGFFVQEEITDYDMNDLTSEGIFIFDGSDAAVDVAVGDLVTITGTVSEFNDKTQITATDVAVTQSDVALPTATVVEFGAGLTPNLEAVESMLINLPDVVVTEMFNLDRFGEIRVADERFAQFTQNNAPDADGNAAYNADIANRTITLDDGQSAQNPFEIRIPDGADYRLTSGDEFRMGDTLQNVEGVLDYSFGQFKVQAPTAEYTPANPRADAPDDLGGNFKVASLNVLNYFTTLNDGSGTQTTVGQNPRGANTPEELARQTEKLVKAIVDMDADVVGLIEIENDVDSAPLKALVAAVNAELGSDVYGVIDTGQVGSDAITNAVIYKLDTANPVGVTDILDADSFVDPLDSPRDGLNRPAVTQSFEHIQSGEVLTVSVNHLKSKGSLSGLDADEGNGDGQGNNNATRTKAAEVLADHLATNPTGVDDADVLIVGDLNAYAQEDPLTALAADGYTDLAYDALGSDAYSYVFDGQIGTLDYVLASGSLTGKVLGVAEWHINSDEAGAVDYETEIRNRDGDRTFGTRDPAIFDGDTAARNSDHDPVVVSFDFGGDVVPPVAGKPSPDDFASVLTGDDGDNPIQGTDAADYIDGGDGRDNINGGAGDDYIIAGAGKDSYVRGGTGSDTFQFGAGDGDVKIYDWEDGLDMICLIDDLSFSDLTQSTQVFNGVTTVIYRTDGGDRIMFYDVDPADIDAADFDGGATPPADGKPSPEDFESVLIGDAGNNPLRGTDIADYIDGGDGRDNIFGGAGDDYIIAGAGKDSYVRGGLGADTFEFGLGDGDVKIYDWENGVDAIHLDGLSLDDLTQTTQVFNDVTTLIYRAEDGSRLMFVGQDTVDFDGSGDLLI